MDQQAGLRGGTDGRASGGQSVVLDQVRGFCEGVSEGKRILAAAEGRNRGAGQILWQESAYDRSPRLFRQEQIRGVCGQPCGPSVSASLAPSLSGSDSRRCPRRTRTGGWGFHSGCEAAGGSGCMSYSTGNQSYAGISTSADRHRASPAPAKPKHYWIHNGFGSRMSGMLRALLRSEGIGTSQ